MTDSEASSSQNPLGAKDAAKEESTARRRVRIREEKDEDDSMIEHPGDRVGDAAGEEEDADQAEIENRIARRRRKQRSELEQTHFKMVNDRVVDDITMDFFYKPHTITVLLIICSVIFYLAIGHTHHSTEWNVYYGALGTLALFLVVSALAFPNGPFIRPHPVIWRVAFGLSVAYALVLQFTLFQSFDDVKKVLTWLDPEGLSKEKLIEKEYAVNCSDLTFERFMSHFDIFAVGHFTGWTMKALLIRHGPICWYISIVWELTEIVFTHMLPNFQECWWDAIILDVLICNGLGIWVGLKICDFLEIRTFHWESIKDIKTTRGKVKRAVLQFTPESWMRVEWPNDQALRRTGSMIMFLMIWLTTELNTFFIKHIFAVDTAHPVVFWRLILIGGISAPSIRQYYMLATDPLVTRLGTQSWVYCAVTALEAAICVKFGRQMFPAPELTIMAIWIVFLIISTYYAIKFSTWWASFWTGTRVEKVNGEERHFYVDSSYENLGLIHDDVQQRRKKLRVASESEYQSDN